MLGASVATGLKTETIQPHSLDKVNVDTTVQEKAVAFPTDARLYYKMRKKLVRLAERHGLKLRQNIDAWPAKPESWSGATRI